MEKKDRAKFTLYGTVYVAHMFRWGDEEKHSYVVGVFTSRQDAIDACVAENIYRGGKYEGRVLETQLNTWGGKPLSAMKKELEDYGDYHQKYLDVEHFYDE